MLHQKGRSLGFFKGFLKALVSFIKHEFTILSFLNYYSKLSHIKTVSDCYIKQSKHSLILS